MPEPRAMGKPDRSTFAIALALLLMLTSATSAAMMAPDRQAHAIKTLALVYGDSVSDLCGTQSHDSHHCPFCHGLPKAPLLGHEGVCFALQPFDGWILAADLYRAAQARNVTHSPRAPPALA